METRIDLLNFFKSEHLAISTIFDREFDLALQNQDWNSLLAFSKDTVEGNHHEKEEGFIFEAIKNIPSIRSGGPLCTYFFDSHMTNPTLRRAIEITKVQSGISLEPLWSNHMQEIRERNLPLVIPGEDHEAGRIILRGVELLLNSNNPASFLKIKELFKVYLEIQKLHFDREENCFFKMCMHLIPPERWDQILLEMNRHYKTICVCDA